MSKCIILTKHTKARMTTLSMQQKDHYTQSNYPTCALSMITGPKRTMQRCRFVFFLPGSTDCQKLCFWKAFPIQSWHCPQHVQITLAFKAGLWTRDFLSAIFWSFLLSFFFAFPYPVLVVCLQGPLQMMFCWIWPMHLEGLAWCAPYLADHFDIPRSTFSHNRHKLEIRHTD